MQENKEISTYWFSIFPVAFNGGINVLILKSCDSEVDDSKESLVNLRLSHWKKIVVINGLVDD